MNKTELIDHIAKKADITKADAGRALNATLDTIVEALTKGEDVALPGFGSFKTAVRAGREGKNPLWEEHYVHQCQTFRTGPRACPNFCFREIHDPLSATLIDKDIYGNTSTQQSQECNLT